ncbi:MAG: hypothetical protein V4710_23310 [Verrucomicrobiota bacterium]
MITGIVLVAMVIVLVWVELGRKAILDAALIVTFLAAVFLDLGDPAQLIVTWVAFALMLCRLWQTIRRFRARRSALNRLHGEES